MKTETQANFARRHGVSQQAVSKAIRQGRFTRAAVAQDATGRWVILDSALADVEWDRNANPCMRPDWPLRRLAAKGGGRGR